MKRLSKAPAIILFTIIVGSSNASNQKHKEDEDQSRIWERYAAVQYSNLNSRVNGLLSPLFSSLGDIGQLYQYFDQRHQPQKYDAYRDFLVQALGDAMRGDVGEAMFAEFVVHITPPDVMLSMIAPEIGRGQKLDGILDSRVNDVAKSLQRQNQQGYPGDPNFDYYVYYLKGNKNRGIADRPNVDVIIAHMLTIDPQRAFHAMLWADYGFRRESGYLHCGKDTEEVRRLQQAVADITDFLFRYQYSFQIADEQEDKVLELLRQLGQHERAWVRLFVACLAEKERNLRSSAVIDPLANDPDERVRNAVARIKTEYPPWQEKTKKK
jgi:hypothetical protein